MDSHKNGDPKTFIVNLDSLVDACVGIRDFAPEFSKNQGGYLKIEDYVKLKESKGNYIFVKPRKLWSSIFMENAKTARKEDKKEEAKEEEKPESVEGAKAAKRTEGSTKVSASKQTQRKTGAKVAKGKGAPTKASASKRTQRKATREKENETKQASSAKRKRPPS